MGLGILLVGILLVWPFTAGSDDGSFVEIGACLFLGLASIFVFCPRHDRPSINSRSVAYVVPLVAYFMVSIIACLFADDIKNLAWLVFGVALFVLMTIRDPTKIPVVEGYRIISYTAVAMYFLFNYEEIINFGVGRGRVSFGNPAYTLSAYALVTATVTSIYAHIHGIGRWYVNAAFFAISLLSVVSTGTRSVYLGLGAVAAVILFGVIGLNRHRLKRFVWILPIAALGIVVTASIPSISERVFVIFEKMVTGFFAFTEGSDAELSALGRFRTRNLAIETFMENPWTGAGYKTLWVDFPVIQAFQDLGIFFGMIFIVAFIIVPMKAMHMAIRRNDLTAVFLCTIYLVNLPRLFFHGQPYDWSTFAYVFPVYGVLLSFYSRMPAAPGNTIGDRASP